MDPLIHRYIGSIDPHVYWIHWFASRLDPLIHRYISSTNPQVYWIHWSTGILYPSIPGRYNFILKNIFWFYASIVILNIFPEKLIFNIRIFNKKRLSLCKHDKNKYILIKIIEKLMNEDEYKTRLQGADELSRSTYKLVHTRLMYI